MGEVVNLSDGHWAQLRDVSAITEAQRRPLRRAWGHVSDEGIEAVTRQGIWGSLSDEDKKLRGEDGKLVYPYPRHRFADSDKDALDELNDVCIIAMLESWSYVDRPITLAAVLDLPPGDYERLRHACSPAARVIFVDFSPSPDPASPTTPSSE